MALKETWRPRIDGVDDADSSAVNEIAAAVIEAETKIAEKIDEVNAATPGNIPEFESNGRIKDSGESIDSIKEYVENRADNTFANALKGSKSGSAILIDDVSPVTREMEVKISSDTVTDLTAVNISRCGKNLLSNLNYIEAKNLTTEIGYSKKIHLKAGFSYTFSIASISNAIYWRFAAHIYENGIMVYAGDNFLQSEDWFTGEISMYCPENQNYFLSQVNETKLENITFTITALKDCAICFGLHLGDTSANTICNNAQIELGSTATEYEPYKECAEYTPTTDGIVEGVKSLYPNTTLMTDTDGVMIDCEYSRDINKAFAALEAAIVTNNS